jgi:TRAP-type C4-dicarboxylate transport system permease small subunit
MALAAEAKPWIEKIAQAGYVSKGITYVLLGSLGFLAAFEFAREDEATQSGALLFVKELPAGVVLLLLLALGLVCYSVWRGVQTFYNPKHEEKKWPKRLRYLFSGLAYLALAFTALRAVFENSAGNGDRNQKLAGELMSQPLGQVLVGLAALVFAGVGIYQIYYGFSEKYRKHVQGLSLHSNHASLLLKSGKIGYISRGVVWVVIAVLFFRAAFASAANEAGSTGKAFRFIEASPFGSYLLAALGLGLMAYGIFNFIRARYENFTSGH